MADTTATKTKMDIKTDIRDRLKVVAARNRKPMNLMLEVLVEREEQRLDSAQQAEREG